ncbi:MAG: PilC/PilY family type IV pilus protein, partial [Gemmatimonadetes bacterium]|nr:PilC/PilY family type IV pilus protein [Gemmatimonadota bacterium]
EEGLADEVVAFARGCAFGTGVGSADVAVPAACATRPAVLGDVFHSNPTVVRHPKAGHTNASYAAFKTAYETRSRVLYAGTNGGFLHGFHAGDWGLWNGVANPPLYNEGSGQELFGLMPWEPRQGIKNQPVDDPTARTYFVDGSPQVADMWLYSNPTTSAKLASGSEWRTVLVGGLRQGGHHYYAVDITNPNGVMGPAGNLPYPGYLWEFPREDDPDDVADPDSFLPYMGQTWGEPILTRVRVKVGLDDNGGFGYERWVAIVTGGYDPTGNPNDSANYDINGTRGRAIYILDAKTGEVLAEKKFDSGAADAQQYMMSAIPSTPAVYDIDFDGYADLIYVGDLQGNLFKWVIHEIGEDRVNDGSGVRTQPNWTFRRFFVAPIEKVGPDSFFKSFFFPPAGALLRGKLYLAVGTGERADISYEGIDAKDENNRFYVMSDLDPGEIKVPPFADLTEADLTDVTGIETATVVANRGFYFIARDGEKFVTNTEIFSSVVIAASFTPTNTGEPCTARGEATLYAFHLLTGEGYFRDAADNPVRDLAIGAGLPSDPKTSVGPDGKDNRVIIETSGTDIMSFEGDDIKLEASGVYWRQQQ